MCVCVQGVLERLDAGEVVIGDGGFVFALEKRGYVKAGPWTPEAAAEHPEAGETLRKPTGPRQQSRTVLNQIHSSNANTTLHHLQAKSSS